MKRGLAWTGRRNTTFIKRLVMKNGAGLPLDTTGYTVRGSVKRRVNDIAVVCSFDVTYDSPRSTGYVWLRIEPEVTVLMTLRDYVFDVVLDKPNGDVAPLGEGNLLIQPAIT